MNRDMDYRLIGREMSPSEYDKVADEDMDMLHDNLEILCEDYMTGAEVEYSVSQQLSSIPSPSPSSPSFEYHRYLIDTDIPLSNDHLTLAYIKKQYNQYRMGI